MKEIFSETIVLEVDVEPVWEYFIDLEANGPKWMPGATQVKVTPDGVIEKGSTVTQITRGKTRTSTVTEFSRLHRVTFGAASGTMHVSYTYTFSNEGGATKLSLLAEAEAKGLAKVLLPMVTKAIKRAESGQLDKFRESFLDK